ncbi:MAG: hypothetical protein ACREUV_07380 [Burkholderiales bacterium]
MSSVEPGNYSRHDSALGFFAVIIGAGRWLELRLPMPHNKLPGWIWPLALAMAGLVLLFYREV